MNPSAVVFVPSPMDHSQQRSSQINFLQKEIKHSKFWLADGSEILEALHEKLKGMHSQLTYEAELVNKSDPHCYAQWKIDDLRSEFQNFADDYNVKNAASLELASHVVTVEQALRALLLKPVPPTVLPKPAVGLNRLGRGRLGIIDGIDHVHRPQSPCALSASTLPPIWEAAQSDDDCKYMEMEMETEREAAPVTPILMLSSELQLPHKPKLQLNAKARVPRLTSLEYRIDDMLQDLMHSDLDTLRERVNKFICLYCVTANAMRLLARKMIVHCIDNEPDIFGAQYALLLQSIVNSENDVDDNYLISLRSTDLKQIIWRACVDRFRDLQLGNCAYSFRNIMIVIAELDSVFYEILCVNRANLCENDIEGLHEILKRCHRVLATSSNEQCLRKYFAIMDKEKHSPKFSHGTQRVRFMVDQMKSLADMNQPLTQKMKRQCLPILHQSMFEHASAASVASADHDRKLRKGIGSTENVNDIFLASASALPSQSNSAYASNASIATAELVRDLNRSEVPIELYYFARKWRYYKPMKK